jgi:hypothetical protein
MIEEFTRGMNFESFREDAKAVAAVERKLLSIGERPSHWVSERRSCARNGMAHCGRGLAAISGVGEKGAEDTGRPFLWSESRLSGPESDGDLQNR